LIQVNFNNLKQEDGLHIYDAYRADLQTQQEVTLEVNRWKARWELYPTGKVRPGHLCETLELVSKNFLSASLLYFENLSYNASLYSNNRKIFQRFETCKDTITRHNETEKTIDLGIATY
jgi:hypothetical protein